MARTLFTGQFASIGGDTMFVGVGEAYPGNAARINMLAQRDSQLGVESVRTEGRDIIVALKPGFDWTDARVLAVRALFA